MGSKICVPPVSAGGWGGGGVEERAGEGERGMDGVAAQRVENNITIQTNKDQIL